jgi:hypothetical protein
MSDPATCASPPPPPPPPAPPAPAPPLPPPPPPLAPLTVQYITAVVTVPGYSVASFDDLAHRQFALGIATVLSIPRDAVLISGVSAGASHAPTAPGAPARRKALQAADSGSSITVHFSIQTDSSSSAALQGSLSHAIMDESLTDGLMQQGMRLTGYVMQALSMSAPTADVPEPSEAPGASELPGAVFYDEPRCVHCEVKKPVISLKYDLWWLVSGGAGLIMILLALYVCVSRRAATKRRVSLPVTLDVASREPRANLEKVSGEVDLDTFHFVHEKKVRCCMM